MTILISDTDIKILNCLKNSKEELNKTQIHHKIIIPMKTSNPRVDYLEDKKLIKKKGKGFILNNINSNEQFINELLKRFKDKI